ncbi:phage antirepressor KilAC domain-containing protein [Eubacterium sp. 1001713B170207_170306_E7]|uniref:phage antirepressor KilAC domain-containing protein n=1 Tax=Eubacterium sp. 1001713B170207_170306_E7 TaxID=2787097 RepID=UPI00189B54E5|nr:phage antirepressor KilAC domain-containing protein [Eubacterium sp. 1001713B170207_170306_E7]
MQKSNKTQTAESRLIQKVFESEEFASVRTLVSQEGGNALSPTVYFVAKDVCEAMDYQNHRQAIKRHVEPEDILRRAVRDKNGRSRTTLVISESGLFALILASRQDKARRFRHYVTSVILPAILHYGAYIEPGQLEALKKDPRGIDILARNLERMFRRCDVVEYQLEKARTDYQRILPDALFGQTIQVAEDCISVGALAKLLYPGSQKKLGQNRLYAWLREQGYLCRRTGCWNHPTQRATALGVLVLRENSVRDRHGRWHLYQKTLVTPKGQRYFMEKLCPDTAEMV